LYAQGTFLIRNAYELRIKESDRIKSLCSNFSLLGIDVEEFDDGFSLSGEVDYRNPSFKGFGDHRIVMTFSILSCLLTDGGRVEDFEAISVSNPDFKVQLKEISS
jgi:3-phosphoshikimate 1-carboxyvinyltransferase